MKLLLIVLIIISFTSCILEKPEDKERHGNPKIFVHPETEVEYYYEVPNGLVLLSEMGEFCENLDFDGGGWEWADIDDLRSIVTDCPSLMIDGSCGITHDNNCLTECDCVDNNGEDQSISDDTSLIHKNDPEKSGCTMFSSTPVGSECTFSGVSVEFGNNPNFKVDFCYNRINNQGRSSLLSNEYTDPICVRNKKDN